MPSPLSKERLADAFRSLPRLVFIPLIVALPPLFWVIEGTYRASLTSLGRDQGIFQYIAWGIEHGLRDYVDMRDVNGPLVHLVHWVFLHLGGRDEHRFRVLDLLASGVAFAFFGACLPGIGARSRSVAPPSLGSILEQTVTRLSWALAAWVVLSGQYLAYLFWDLAQRESFFDWFLMTSVGLQLVAQRWLSRDATTFAPSEGAVSAETSRRRPALWLLLLSGALSIIPWFGKATYALFTAIQLLSLLVDRLAVPRRKALGAWVIGMGVGASTQIAFLVATGDARAFARIYLYDVPTLYRFIWPKSPAEIFSFEWTALPTAGGILTSIVMVALIIDRQLPRRAVAVALLPIGGLVNVIAQGKGFAYHFHPVTAGLSMCWLLLIAWASERFVVTRPVRADSESVAEGRREPPSLGASIAVLAAFALSIRVSVGMVVSPHIQALWILHKGTTAESRTTHDYFVYFQTADFFPWEMRQSADYLRAHTRDTDRVQTYGMDPYLLFLAERESATPYLYAYDLNVDTALAGANLPEGLHPNDAQMFHIRALRDAHEADLLERVQREPPAAFVFFDHAPLLSEDDAFQDFAEHSERSAAWVSSHYKETAAFGDDHIWLRNDLAEAAAAAVETTQSSPQARENSL